MENKILELENKLFCREFCCNKNNLDKVLHSDFFEYGKSGRIITRKETIDYLLLSDDRDIHIKDFACTKIDNNTYIAHYIAINNDEKLSSLRTSIWINSNNSLKLYFHQGTKV